MNIVTRFRFIPQYLLKSMVREISTTPSLQRTPRSLVKLKKLQAEFQCDDGNPVWLKRGISDKILYTSVLVLCVCGVLGVVLTLFDNAKPESWKSKASC